MTDKRLLTVVQSTTNSQGAQIVDHHVGRRHIGFYKGKQNASKCAEKT